MTRTFCDVCGKEIETTERLKRQKGDVRVEVLVTYKGVSNGGHFCENCILDIINTGEPTGGFFACL